MLGVILVETPDDIGSWGGARVAERVRVREITDQEGTDCCASCAGRPGRW
jgi:hypothetical protein